MKKELDNLKREVAENSKINSEQIEEIDEINKNLRNIKDTYRSDINFLVNLGLTEVRKHLPAESKDDNLQRFRELLYYHVLLGLKDYEKLVSMPLDRFINIYGKDLSFILAESIYTFKVYNSSEGYPSIFGMFDKIKAALENTKHMQFLLKTYFPRLFTFIETNREELFEQIRSKKHNIFSDKTFEKYILRESAVDLSDIDSMIHDYLFSKLPTFYATSLFYNFNQNSYVTELEQNLISLPLDSCKSLQTFNKTWRSFNVVKNPDVTIIVETEKTRMLRELISNNKIFKGIYQSSVERYNAALPTFPRCDIGILPVEYKALYDPL